MGKIVKFASRGAARQCVCVCACVRACVCVCVCACVCLFVCLWATSSRPEDIIRQHLQNMEELSQPTEVELPPPPPKTLGTVSG